MKKAIYCRLGLGALMLLLAGIGLWFSVFPRYEVRCLLRCWQQEHFLSDKWVEGAQNDDECQQARNQTLETVRRFGSRLVPFLVSRLVPPHNRFADRMNGWLGKIPNFSLRWPENQDWSYYAFTGLKTLGPQSVSGIPGLEILLNHPIARPNAAQALVAIGPDALPVLMKNAEHPDRNIRIAVLQAMGDFKHSSRTNLLPLVFKELHNPDIQIQDVAAELVGTFPEAQERASFILARLLNDSSDLLPASGAALGLAEFGDDSLCFLLESLDSTNRFALAAAWAGLFWQKSVIERNLRADPEYSQLGFRCLFNLKMLSMISRETYRKNAADVKSFRKDLLISLLSHPRSRVSNLAKQHLDKLDMPE